MLFQREALHFVRLFGQHIQQQVTSAIGRFEEDLAEAADLFSIIRAVEGVIMRVQKGALLIPETKGLYDGVISLLQRILGESWEHAFVYVRK